MAKPKLEKLKLNRPGKSVTDDVIGQMITPNKSEPDSTAKKETDQSTSDRAKKSKTVYSKDEHGNTVGANGKKIGRPKVANKKVQLSFNVTQTLKDELTEFCQENGMPLSLAMSYAAKEYLEKYAKS